MSEIDNKTDSNSNTTLSLQQKLAAYDNICAQLRNIPDNLLNCGIFDVKKFDEEIAGIRSSYSNLPELQIEYKEIADRNFNEAYEMAMSRRTEFLSKTAAKDTLVAEMKQLLEAGDLLTLPELSAFEEKYKKFFINDAAALAEYEDKFGTIKKQLSSELAEAERLSGICEKLTEELKALLEQDDIRLLQNRKNDIDAAFHELGTKLPVKDARRFKDVRHKVAVKLSQYFETLDLERWASYTKKCDLLKKLDELLNADAKDLPQTAKTLQEIRIQWKTIGSVPHEKSEEINPKFLESTKILQHRIDEFFQARRKEQKDACDAKEELIKQAEELSTSTDWGPSSGAFRDLQAKWKLIPRAGNSDTPLYKRFRAAADVFFNARNAAFAEKEKYFQKITDAKQSLINEASNLQDTRRAKQLRAEYQALPSAGRKEQELYESFNAALDKFFTAKREESSKRDQESKALIEEVKQLTSSPLTAINRIREIRAKLDELNNRNTLTDENHAFADFDKALAKNRIQENEEKLVIYAQLAEKLGEQLNNFLDNKPMAIEDIEGSMDAFPKLLQTAKLLKNAAQSEKDAEKIRKQVKAARQEYEKLTDEAEKLAGISSDNSVKETSLAAELEAAICGNFAKDEAKQIKKNATPDDLRRAFINAGLLPAAEFTEIFKRFNNALDKCKNKNF